ncbi:hypothetical protein XA68_10139 [Ophiocordyceps unilateralis]|uniref:Uncharacterized protein n=1 Tax=Ophiocordyceps unilateralis TaxID=268505 RepID=A0A2A9PI45_OPHUN|nr:hypothetical protein XA68_10139 [Ophiocordyceps unilateralis]
MKPFLTCLTLLAGTALAAPTGGARPKTKPLGESGNTRGISTGSRGAVSPPLPQVNAEVVRQGVAAIQNPAAANAPQGARPKNTAASRDQAQGSGQQTSETSRHTPGHRLSHPQSSSSEHGQSSSSGPGSSNNGQWSEGYNRAALEQHLNQATAESSGEPSPPLGSRENPIPNGDPPPPYMKDPPKYDDVVIDDWARADAMKEKPYEPPPSYQPKHTPLIQASPPPPYSKKPPHGHKTLDKTPKERPPSLLSRIRFSKGGES